MRFEFKHTDFAKAIKQKRVIEENSYLRPLAKKISVSPATLSRCENSFGPPDLRTFVKICTWLGRPVTDFYSITQRKK